MSCRIATTIASVLPQGLRVISEKPTMNDSVAKTSVTTATNAARPPIQGTWGNIGKSPCAPQSPKKPGLDIPSRNSAANIPATARYTPYTHHRMPSVCTCCCTLGMYIIGGGTLDTGGAA